MIRRLCWFLEADDEMFVDVDEPNRKRLIREAEYQAQADADSRVLRVSGQRSVRRRLPTVPPNRELREV